MLFKKIIFPIKDPKKLGYLLNKAQLIEELGAEELHVVHIVTAAGKIGEAHRRLSNSLNLLALDFRLSFEITTGNPAVEISRIAKEEAFDLIYVYSNPSGRISRMLLGNTAADIIRLADTPTLVDKSVPNPALNSILYATDFRSGAYKALRYVKDWASANRVLFIQFVGTRAVDPHSEQRRMKKVESDFRLLTQKLSNYAKVTTIHSLGRPAAEIKKTIQHSKPDLLILGKGNPKGLEKTILGSIAEKLVSSVDCLVLVIP